MPEAVPLDWIRDIFRGAIQLSENQAPPCDFPAGYIFRGLIGQGGFGWVCRAHQASLRRDVAIKFMRRDRALSENELMRFQREIEVLKGLSHPRVISLLDADFEFETPLHRHRSDRRG